MNQLQQLIQQKLALAHPHGLLFFKDSRPLSNFNQIQNSKELQLFDISNLTLDMLSTKSNQHEFIDYCRI